MANTVKMLLSLSFLVQGLLENFTIQFWEEGERSGFKRNVSAEWQLSSLTRRITATHFWKSQTKTFTEGIKFYIRYVVILCGIKEMFIASRRLWASIDGFLEAKYSLTLGKITCDQNLSIFFQGLHSFQRVSQIK